MKVFTTTQARKDIANIIDRVRQGNVVFGVGRRNKAEVLLIKYPDHVNPSVGEITNINANSSSFDFLKTEPDLYSIADLKKSYAR